MNLVAGDIQNIVKSVAQYTADSLPATHVFVSELINCGNKFRFRATVGFENSKTGLPYERVSAEQVATMSLLSKDTFIIDASRKDLTQRVSHMLGGLDIHCGASVPILCGGYPWGVFGAYSDTTSQFDKSKSFLLKVVANHIAEVIQQSSHLEANILEANIVAAKQEWLATVDALPQPIFVLDSEGRVLRVNRTAEAWGCGEVAQARGWYLTEILKPITGFTDSTLLIDWFDVRKRLAVQDLVEWELDHRPRGKVLRLTFRAISANSYTSGNDEAYFAVLVIDDITKLKTAEEQIYQHAANLEKVVKLRTAELQKTNKLLEHELAENRRAKARIVRSHERYASLVESTLVGFCVVSKGKIMYCNTRFADMFCYMKLELFGKKFLMLVHPEDRCAAAQKFEEIVKRRGGFDEPISIRARNKSGKFIWLDLALSLKDKNIESDILVNVEDITAKKKVELMIRDSERQHRLFSYQLIDAQEMERKRIAAELHDGLGQIMGAIKYKVEGIMAGNADSSCATCFGQLQKVVNDIRGAMDEVRNIAMALRPSTLDDLGVLLTIDWFCREFQNTYTGIKVEKKIVIEESAISEERKLVIYRIIQEAMNNTAKYAKATLIGLILTGEEDGIHLNINDNGLGFNMACVPDDSSVHGFGLRTMRERAELTGGLFSIESVTGRGTSVRVFWPEYINPGVSNPGVLTPV